MIYSRISELKTAVVSHQLDNALCHFDKALSCGGSYLEKNPFKRRSSNCCVSWFAVF